MSLPAGTRLGPYEILAPIGAGGMGEVYRARDTRLGRDVAVKVLPAEFAHDPERLRRFEQEARAAAALNHPNILVLYDIGTQEDAPYIVTELLEGETLRQRLRSGPVPPAKAVDFGAQIAQGLAAAHEKGIVHRDLKPENLFITREGRVKILDFGLARLRPQEPVLAEGRSEAATADSPTREGKVLGTPGYMAPEQVRGHAADARSDIFAFGLVLYEMLAGRRAFEGATATDVAAAVLTKDPPPLPPAAPPALSALVRRCLEKRPEDRFSSTRDLAFALEAVSGSGSAVPATTTGAQVVIPRGRLWVGAIVVAGVLLATTAVLVALYVNRAKKAPSRPFEHMNLTRLTHGGLAQGYQGFVTGRPAISPDGRYVAYFKNDESGRSGLWVQHIATSSAVQVVPASEDRPVAPTFSPDGSYIYFLAHPKGRPSQLHRVPVLGGAPERLPLEHIDTPVTFSPDGRQVAFARGNEQHLGELHIANLDGSGERMLAVTTPDSDTTGGPAWSPDGSTIAWTRREAGKGVVQLVDVKTGAVRRLGERAWDLAWELEWVPDGRGLLVIAKDLGLQEQPQIWFVEVPSGAARPITSDVGTFIGVSVSADGRSLASVRIEMRSDVRVAPFSAPSEATQVTFGSDTADGMMGLAWTPAGGLVYCSNAGGRRDLWLQDRPGAEPRRLTNDTRIETTPAVSPDGRTIVFTVGSPAASGTIWRMDTDGGNPKQLTAGPIDGLPLITKEGRWVVYTIFSPECRTWRVPIEGGTPEALGGPDAKGRELFKDFWGLSQSPDGRSLAGWVQDRRGWTLAVVPLDGSGPRAEIQDPIPMCGFLHWAPDGRSIFYEVDGRPTIFRKTLDRSPVIRYLDLKEGARCLFAISPDGKQLAYAHETESSDVVLIQQTEEK